MDNGYTRILGSATAENETIVLLQYLSTALPLPSLYQGTTVVQLLSSHHLLSTTVLCTTVVELIMCCHQSRDIPTPGFPKLPRDGEKHNPVVVFGSSICWA